MIPDDREVVRPNCKCHGVPMRKRSKTPAGRPAWKCAVAAAASAERARARLKAEGQCVNQCGRAVRIHYTECPECIEHRQTDPTRLRQIRDGHTKHEKKLREEKIAGRVAEIEAIQKRIRDAN